MWDSGILFWDFERILNEFWDFDGILVEFRDYNQILVEFWDSYEIVGGFLWDSEIFFWDSLEGFFKFHLTCRSISTKNNSQTKNLNYEFSHLTVEIHRPVDDRLAAKISER